MKTYKLFYFFCIILAINLIAFKNQAISQQVERKPLVAYLQDSLWHILDESGKEMFKPMKIEYLGGYSEGFFVIRKAIGNDTIWGYLNLQGKMAVPPNAKFLDLFHNGYARYATWETGLEDIKYYGYLRKDGVAITPPMYLDATNFNEGYAYVMNYDERGYIDTTGKIVKHFKQGFGEPFYEGLAVIQDTSAHFGYIDKSFKIAVKLEYDEAHNFSQGLARVNKDGYFGYIDTNGLMAIPPFFVMATDFKESRAFVAHSAKLYSIKWAPISSSGKILTDFIFDDIRDFSQGIAAVRQKDSWFFINLFGDKFLPTEYEFAESFVDGLAFVKEKNGKKRQGYIDVSGKFQVIIPKTAQYIFDLRVNRLCQ